MSNTDRTAQILRPGLPSLVALLILAGIAVGGGPTWLVVVLAVIAAGTIATDVHRYRGSR